jgi:hypothetical protein
VANVALGMLSCPGAEQHNKKLLNYGPRPTFVYFYLPKDPYIIILAKYWLGFILGYFFTDTTGHPVSIPPGRKLTAVVFRVARCYIFRPKIAIWVNFG